MAMRKSIDASSVLSGDDLSDYDFISEGHRSLESSIADLGVTERNAADIYEPPASQAARDKFLTPGFDYEDIQTYVQRVVDNNSPSNRSSEAVVRVYVDGVFDPFHAGHALQLRQAKLSFPRVHLMVGVHPDADCIQHGHSPLATHLERCELLRHCRWVDEIVPEAPWRLDEAFLRARRIDYVAIDEGISIDPACEKEKLKGYDLVKGIRKFIPTRRTTALTIVEPRSQMGTPRLQSRQATLRGTPPVLEQVKDVLENRVGGINVDKGEVVDSPFEEPKIDEFGTGAGA